MATLVFALPAEHGYRLSVAAARYGHDVLAHCEEATEVMAALALRPDAIVIAADPRFLSAAVLAAADAAGVRLVALIASPAERKNVAALGVREGAALASEWPEIDSIIAHDLPDTAEKPTRGSVIAVWGPAGAPGRTAVAITLAAELAVLGHRVLLADVDTHGASVAPALGLLDEAPGFAAACRLAGTESLTPAELERIAQHYESTAGGFRVLTGIGRPSRWPELSGERVAATIECCRSWADVVVLDTASSLENDEEIMSDLFAPRRNAAALAAVQSADRIVAVGSADPVGMSRLLRAHADMLETASTADVTVVMNRVRSSAIGFNPVLQVNQTLARFGGIHSAVIVPHDLAAFDTAVLAGKTVTDVSPRSPARVALRDLAARLLPAAVPSRSRRR